MDTLELRTTTKIASIMTGIATWDLETLSPEIVRLVAKDVWERQTTALGGNFSYIWETLTAIFPEEYLIVRHYVYMRVIELPVCAMSFRVYEDHVECYAHFKRCSFPRMLDILVETVIEKGLQ